MRAAASRWAEKMSFFTAFMIAKAGRPSVRTNQSHAVEPDPWRGASVVAEMSYPLTRGVTRGRRRARRSRLNSESVSWPVSLSVDARVCCWAARRTDVAQRAFERFLRSRTERVSPPSIWLNAARDTESR